MKQFMIFITLMLVISQLGCSQAAPAKIKNTVRVGGSCEGCRGVYESPVPFDKIPSEVYLPDYNEEGPKIAISGVIYKRDGKTPASGVVLYVYHTNQKGVYPKKGDEIGWGKQHGYIRGWVRSDAQGRYKIYTLKPAAYPGRKDPAHIHTSIKEPDRNEYWIDDFVFDDDPLLTDEDKNKQDNRGGSGVLHLVEKKGIMEAKRDIILGLNVPDYQ